jgi:hypothetical protein
VKIPFQEKKSMKYILIISLFFSLSLDVWCQPVDSAQITLTEHELSEAFNQLYTVNDDQVKDSLNTYIISVFSKVLENPFSFSYNWDALQKIGKVKSADRRFKTFTWHLQRTSGVYEYFGFIQYFNNSKKNPEVQLISLRDNSAEIKNPTTADLSPDNWYGALYYGITTFSHKRETYYALLGFDFNNNHSHKKLVEVVHAGRDGELEMGAEIHTGDKVLRRMFIEYSADLVASLRYDENLKMIVFDHVAPFQPMLAGNYRFYGPDGSFDGLKFEDGKFVLQEDIDARNF